MVTNERLESGRHNDIEQAYRRLGSRLWRAVLIYSGDREVANDAVAEAFAQALRRGSAIRSLDNWIWSTAFRVTKGLLKERSRFTPSVPDVSYELPDETLSLAEVLRTLSPAQRATVILHYYGNYRIREIAGMLDMTSASVGVHLHRARRRLKARLEEDNG